MRYGEGDVVLVPADTFVVDRVFEAMFVVVQPGRAGFDFEARLSLAAVKIGKLGKSPFATSKPKIARDRSILK